MGAEEISHKAEDAALKGDDEEQSAKVQSLESGHELLEVKILDQTEESINHMADETMAGHMNGSTGTTMPPQSEPVNQQGKHDSRNMMFFWIGMSIFATANIATTAVMFTYL